MSQNLEELSDAELEAIINQSNPSDDLENLSDEELERIASGVSKEDSLSGVSKTESALRGAAQGATFSLQPYISSALETRIGSLDRAITGQSAFDEEPVGIGDRIKAGLSAITGVPDARAIEDYQRSLSTQIDQRDAARQANPVTFGASQFGGALLTAPVTGVAGGAYKAARGANAARSMLASAIAKDSLVDGAIGAAENVAAEAPTNVEDALKNAAFGFGVSAVTSGLLKAPSFAKAGKPLISPSASRMQLEEMSEGINSAVYRAKAVGATATDLRGTTKNLVKNPIVKSAKELQNRGFFKKGQRQFNPETRQFDELKGGILPPSQEELLFRTEEGVEVAAEELKKVLRQANKSFTDNSELGLSKIKSNQLPGFSALKEDLAENIKYPVNRKGMTAARKTIEAVEESINAKDGSDLLRLQDIKQRLGRELNDKTFLDRSAEDKRMLRGLYSVLKEGIENKAEQGLKRAAEFDPKLQLDLSAVNDLNRVQSELLSVQSPLAKALGRERGTIDLPSVTQIVGASGTSYLTGSASVGIAVEGLRKGAKSSIGYQMRANLSDAGRAFVDGFKQKPKLALDFVRKNFPEMAEEVGALAAKGIPEWQLANAVARQPSVLRVFEDQKRSFTYNPGTGEFDDPTEAKSFIENMIKDDEGDSSIKRAKELKNYGKGRGLK